MRVLLVADVSAEKVQGGAERMLMNHVRAISGAGHELSVLTRQPDPDALSHCELGDGVVEHRLPFSGSRKMGDLLRLRSQARGWWREHASEFDVVVAEQPITMWALRQSGCCLPRLQVCYSFAYEEYATRHGLDWNLRHQLVTAAMRRLEAKVYGSADRILVLSAYSRHRLVESFGMDKPRIQVASAGARLPDDIGTVARKRLRDRLGWKGPVIVTLRNLVPRTGVDMFIQAAAMLQHDVPELHWCVIGDGPLLEPLQSLAAELGVAGRIEFTGYLPENEVTQRMQTADIFMLPTRSLEGFGLVTLEANACGLPVVATPVGANPEVAGSTPINRLASAISPESLAEAVKDLLRHKVDYMQRAERLRAHVRDHFSWAHHDSSLIGLIEALGNRSNAA